MPMSLWQWLKKIFERCGQDGPDGRPLYSYRIDGLQFLSLMEILKHSSRNDVSWPAAFVLFAAEWWRREYAGGAWSWAPILEEIGIRSDSISAQERSRIVKDGLDFWRRPVRSSDQNQQEYLLSIILEGGLPLRRLQHEHAGGDKLLPLLQKAASQVMARKQWGATSEEIVRSHMHKLPQSFRSPEVVDVLSAIVDACVNLRETYDLHDKLDPVSWLNQHVGEKWKWQFPLSMEDESAKGLLESLIRDLAKAPNAEDEFSIRRVLQRMGNSSYQLQASVGMPVMVSSDALEAFGSALESQMTLVAIADDYNRPVASLGLYASDRYRVRSLGAAITNKPAHSEFLLRLENTRTGQIVGEKAPLGGAGLDDDLPWVFIEDGNTHLFLGQGNVSVKYDACLVVADGNQCEVNDNTIFEKIGTLADTQRSVYRLEGELDIFRDGIRTRVRTRQESFKAWEYVLEGKRLSWTSNPSMVFIGFPKITAWSNTGSARPVAARDIRYRFHASDSWKALVGLSPTGIMEIAAFDNDLLLFRRRIAVLQRDAEILFKPSANPQSGRIAFHNLGTTLITVAGDEAIETEANMDDANFHLSLSTKESQPPAQIDVTIAWRGQPDELTVTLPFPACGARFFDGEKSLGRRSIVFAEKLHGIHARIFNQAGSLPMQVTLIANLVGKVKVAFWRDLGLIDTYSEVRLIHYVDDIRRLFAATETLDSTVRFTIFGNGRELERLEVQRYEAGLIECPDALVLSSVGRRPLSLEELQQTQVNALPVWLPEREPDRLKQRMSENVPTGLWSFEQMQQFPGPWMVYPDVKSSIVFRPTLYIARGDVVIASSCPLSQSCLAPTAGERAARIDSQFIDMAENPRHSSWMFFQNTVRKFGHLPLNSLDLLVRAAHCSRIMAQAVLQLDVPDFDFTRFSRDLPFLWEQVPFGAWRRAIMTVASLYDQLPQELIIYKMGEKFLDAAPYVPEAGLKFLQLLYAQEQMNITGPVIDIVTLRIINDMGESLQAMLRDTCDQQPPDALDMFIDSDKLPKVFEPLMQRMQNHFDSGTASRKTVLMLPVIMGISWLTGVDYLTLSRLSSQDSVRCIQESRSFHPDWFKKCMNCTIEYGLMQYYGKKFNVPSLELRPSDRAAG